MSTNSPTRRLVLHIGNSKAGSSSLQRFFFENRSALKHAGVLYPTDRWRPVDAQHNIAFSMLDDPVTRRLYNPRRLTPVKLASLIAGAQEDVILLSTEHFSRFADHPDALSALVEFARKHDLQLDVIVFLRAQPQYLESSYAQTVKTLRCGTDFRKFLDDHIDDRRFDYMRQLAAWESLPGTRLVPLPFTVSRLVPDLETTFLEAAGLADRLPGLIGQTRAAPRNTTPGPMTVELCRRASLTIDPDPSRNDLHADLQLLNDLQVYFQDATDAAGWNDTAFVGLDAKLRDRIADRFADDNETVARRYWGRGWFDTYRSDYKANPVPNELAQREMTMSEETDIEGLLRGAAQHLAWTARTIGRIKRRFQRFHANAGTP